MKERAIDHERAVVADDQAPEVPQPADGAFDDPPFSVPAQCSAILCRRTNAISLVGTDQFDASLSQALPQRIAIVGFVGDHAHGLLPWTARVMTPSYADRGERRFREPDFRRG